MNHRESWDLIPWIANGSIADADREAVLRHIGECAGCRAELDAQRGLMQAMKARPLLVESMPHGSLQKLRARIDAEPAPARREAPPATRPPRLTGALAAAVVLQAVLLGIMSIALFRPPGAAGPAEYRTVSSAQRQAAGAPGVRAVFSPSMTLGELQALLERSRLRIVDGPSPDGVYTLAPVSADDDPGQALLTLRAHPAVRFAEPVGP